MTVQPDPGAPYARFRGVIALDGPSGTGKSTVARGLARRLHARYLDTGAMYRAATVAVLRADVPTQDAGRVVEAVQRARIDISTDPSAPSIRLDGDRVDAEIRSAEVTAAVSAVSAVSAVRALLVSAQRELIAAGAIVVEGRDIATVVWPTADPKIYLTASAETRARRRAGELGALAEIDQVAADIERRDRLDSTRATGPLSKSADAVEFDTTDLDVDQVIDQLVDMAMSSGG